MHLFLFCVNFVEQNSAPTRANTRKTKPLRRIPNMLVAMQLAMHILGPQSTGTRGKGELIIPYGSRLRIRRYFAKSEAKA